VAILAIAIVPYIKQQLQCILLKWKYKEETCDSNKAQVLHWFIILGKLYALALFILWYAALEI